MNAGYILTRSAKYYPNNDALMCEGRKLTYSQLNAEVNALANSLLDLGLKKGDHVGLLFHNSVAYVEFYLALYKIGLVWVRLNHRLSPRELAAQMMDAGVTMVIYGKDMDMIVNDMLALVKGIEVKTVREKGEKDLSYTAMLQQGSKAEPNIDVTLDDLSDIWFTSGTTGEPKGIMLTHRNIMTCRSTKTADIDRCTNGTLFHSSDRFFQFDSS